MKIKCELARSNQQRAAATAAATAAGGLEATEETIKLDVSDVMYDSSSSVSSDSAASSQSSRSNHDFLSSITNSYTPSSMLVSSLDGLHSGVPTRTTPTLTPTTLRTIEQTFLEFTSEPASHSREAGFVPPLIEPSQPTPAQTQNNVIQQHHQQQQQHQHQQQNNILLDVQQTQQHQPLQNITQLQLQQQQPHLETQQQQQQQQVTQQPQPTRRNMGGRRPTRTVGMTPEEEERRQIRRERNKLAAARCRKRRMDHTNALLIETEGLEQKKQSLQEEIQSLQSTKEELEYMLETHRPLCRLQSSSPPDIKPVVTEPEPCIDLHSEQFSDLSCNGAPKQQQQQQQQQLHHHQQQQQQPHNNNLNNGLRPNRPNSLPVGFADAANQRPNSLPIFTEPKPRPSSLQFKQVETPAFMKTATEVAGIPITTPSTGIPFNFDSLMEGGTGLTPVSTPLIPSCSSQQRNNLSNGTSTASLSAVDLSSPDANPPKLVSL